MMKPPQSRLHYPPPEKKIIVHEAAGVEGPFKSVANAATLDAQMPHDGDGIREEVEVQTPSTGSSSSAGRV